MQQMGGIFKLWLTKISSVAKISPHLGRVRDGFAATQNNSSSVPVAKIQWFVKETKKRLPKSEERQHS